MCFHEVERPPSYRIAASPIVPTVRAFSFFGDSYVDVLFDDNTDLYWARSRVEMALWTVSSLRCLI